MEYIYSLLGGYKAAIWSIFRANMDALNSQKGGKGKGEAEASTSRTLMNDSFAGSISLKEKRRSTRVGCTKS